MNNRKSGPWRSFIKHGPLYLAPLFFLCLSFVWGRYPVSPILACKVIAAKFLPIQADWSPVIETVIFKVRLPRIAAAMLIGGGLSVSGAAFQGLFRNPLVSPYILGVASGAGCGAALAILLFDNSLAVQLFAFLFGIIAVGLSYSMSRLYRFSSTLVLVLSGVIVGTFFSSMISLIKYMADPYDKLPVIVFWLMGSLATVNNNDVLTIAGPMLTGIIALFLVRWKINVLSMGEDEAKAMGVDTDRLRILIVLAATMITAAAVSISGIIGWVGLVIPHFARMVSGPNYRQLIPASFSIGACYLLLIDDLARNMSAAEVPLGILTASIGAPFFALILKKSSLGWS